MGGRASEIRGELGVLKASVDQKDIEKTRFQKKFDEVKTSEKELVEKATSLNALLKETKQEDIGLTESIAQLNEEIDKQKENRNLKWEELADAKAALRATEAEIEAFGQAINRINTTATSDFPTNTDGVIGILSDLIQIEPGYETAFETATDGLLSTVIFDTTENAIQALNNVEIEDRSFSLASLDANFTESDESQIGDPLRRHVSSTNEILDSFLDRILLDVIVHEGDLRSKVETLLKNPRLTIVNKNGDRFSSSGWRIGQRDKANIKKILKDAQNRFLSEEKKVQEKQLSYSQCESKINLFENDLSEQQKQLEECKSKEASLSESIQRLRVEQKTLDIENQTLEERISENEQRIKEEIRQITELQIHLQELEEAEKTSVQAAQRMADERSQLESRSAETAARRTECEVRSADIRGRLAVVKERVNELDTRLERLSGERTGVADRTETIEKKETATSFLLDSLDLRNEIIERRLTELRNHRRDQSDRVRKITSQLDELRSSRRKREDEVRKLREEQARLEIERAETRLKLENLTETIRSEFEREPNSIGELPSPELPEGLTVSERIAELERELKLIGPINPLALYEFDDLKERYEFLEEQLEDVRSTRKELRKVIRSIDIEIKEVFAAAFAEVSTNFNDLFEVLFPGGNGKLSLTDPENLLETGIEIEARPSGKNVKKLSLLSGGERSLTALAFLFAVFRSRPSPFYVMDEVEAALDDANLFRFLGLVDQFRDESQLLIVTHQKRTMEAADCLYGVSMASGGSSKVVSERVEATRSAERLGMLAS